MKVYQLPSCWFEQNYMRNVYYLAKYAWTHLHETVTSILVAGTVEWSGSKSPIEAIVTLEMFNLFSFLFLNKPLSFQFSIRHYVFVLNLTRGNAAVIETGLRLDWVKAVERAGAQRVTCVTRRPAPQRPCVSSRALPEGRRPHSLTQTWAASRTTRWIVSHGSTLTQVKWSVLSLSGISQRPGLRPKQHTSVLSSYQYNVVHLWYYTRNCCCSLCQPAGGDRT